MAKVNPSLPQTFPSKLDFLHHNEMSVRDMFIGCVIYRLNKLEVFKKFMSTKFINLSLAFAHNTHTQADETSFQDLCIMKNFFISHPSVVAFFSLQFFFMLKDEFFSNYIFHLFSIICLHRRELEKQHATCQKSILTSFIKTLLVFSLKL
jgi:hypothetical protein